MAKGDKDPVESTKPGSSKNSQNAENPQKWKKTRPKRDPEEEDDERFKGIRKDPRFRPFRREERKIKVDDRFKAMLTDPKFNLTHKVDRRGRPAKVKSSAENLRKFYSLEDEERNGDEEKEEEEKVEGKKEMKKKKQEDKVSDEEEQSKEVPDYARGEGQLQSSSSEDESSSDEESDAASDLEEVEHPWGELDADAPRSEEDLGATRLAVCNMDWDRVTAKDLVVALSSFMPSAGASLKSVKIYKSEFGKQRMAVEEVSGPSELKDVKVQAKSKNDSKESDEDSDDEVMREKVRKYQLNRLKYYYAVAAFDSPATANHVYEQCDGVEYESSATRFDLRLIPEEETFDEADVVDSCSHEQLDLEKYQPHLFISTALQQGKVRCTWDETDPKREKTIETIFKSLNPTSKKEKKAMKKAGKPVDIDGLNDDDWRAYLASDTSEEEPEEEESEVKQGNGDGKKAKKDRLAAYKEILDDIKSKEAKEEKDKAHMEISWHPVDVEPVKELVEKKKEEAKVETPWDRYLAKLKEKKKQKKKPGDGEDAEPEDSRNELTKEELDDPFFASSNLDGEEDYDPMSLLKSGVKKDEKKKKKQKEEEEAKEKEGDKEDLDLLTMDVDEDEGTKKHFNLNRIMKIEKLKSKKKLYKKDKKKLKELGTSDGDGFAVDVADPRFGAVYSSHNFSVDPSDPLFKPTPGMKAIVDEKRKRRVENADPVVDTAANSEQGKAKSEMNSLVQSVKRKAIASKFKPKRGKF